eukprot:COSAG02_NODE_14240_length_1294_cov_2.182427_1_plen_164_part_00
MTVRLDFAAALTAFAERSPLLPQPCHKVVDTSAIVTSCCRKLGITIAPRPRRAPAAAPHHAASDHTSVSRDRVRPRTVDRMHATCQSCELSRGGMSAQVIPVPVVVPGNTSRDPYQDLPIRLGQMTGATHFVIVWVTSRDRTREADFGLEQPLPDWPSGSAAP